jgi:hypothetical protein
VEEKIPRRSEDETAVNVEENVEPFSVVNEDPNLEMSEENPPSVEYHVPGIRELEVAFKGMNIQCLFEAENDQVLLSKEVK